MTQTRMRMTPTEFGEYWKDHAQAEAVLSYTYGRDEVRFPIKLYNSPEECLTLNCIELLDEPV